MSRTRFWYGTAGFTGWAIVLLGALRSEPLWDRLLGDQYSVTHHWCGAWGCSAALPKLLAWQVPMVLLMVPATWLLVCGVPLLQRWSRLLALVTVLGTLGWLTVETVQAWNRNQIHSIGDVGRHLIFVGISGTSVVIPLLLAAATCLSARRRVPSSGSNPDTRSMAEQSEDLSDVVILHVDTAT